MTTRWMWRSWQRWLSVFLELIWRTWSTPQPSGPLLKASHFQSNFGVHFQSGQVVLSHLTHWTLPVYSQGTNIGQGSIQMVHFSINPGIWLSDHLIVTHINWPTIQLITAAILSQRSFDHLIIGPDFEWSSAILFECLTTIPLPTQYSNDQNCNQMVRPFQYQNSICQKFKCFWYSDIRSSDPHCIEGKKVGI